MERAARQQVWRGRSGFVKILGLYITDYKYVAIRGGSTKRSICSKVEILPKVLITRYNK